VELEDGNNIVLNKNGTVSVLAEDGRELETHTVVIGAVISIKDGAKVKKGDTFVQWDPYNVPILSEKAGKIKFHDIIEGVTMKQEVDETTAQEAMVIIDHKEDLHPQIIVLDNHGEEVANYPIPSGAHIVVQEGTKIVAGTPPRSARLTAWWTSAPACAANAASSSRTPRPAPKRNTSSPSANTSSSSRATS
jgi:DNA-directed RNA polymerase subunit beta'